MHTRMVFVLNVGISSGALLLLPGGSSSVFFFFSFFLSLSLDGSRSYHTAVILLRVYVDNSQFKHDGTMPGPTAVQTGNTDTTPRGS